MIENLTKEQIRIIIEHYNQLSRKCIETKREGNKSTFSLIIVKCVLDK